MFDNFDFDFEKYKNQAIEFYEDKKKWFKAANTFLIRYFKLFVLGVVVFMLIIGFLVLLWPKYKEVKSLVKSSKQQQQEVFLQKHERLDDLRSIIDSYKSISESQKNKVDEVIPERRNKEEIFTEVKNLVARNGLSLKSITLEGDKEKEEKEREEERMIVRRQRSQEQKEEEEEEDYEKRELPADIERIRFNLFVVGTNYNSLRSLLITLENNLSLMDIININFNPEGKTTNMIVDAYQLK